MARARRSHAKTRLLFDSGNTSVPFALCEIASKWPSSLRSSVQILLRLCNDLFTIITIYAGGWSLSQSKSVRRQTSDVVVIVGQLRGDRYLLSVVGCLSRPLVRPIYVDCQLAVCGHNERTNSEQFIAMGGLLSIGFNNGCSSSSSTEKRE
jgi:hypothetical protein